MALLTYSPALLNISKFKLTSKNIPFNYFHHKFSNKNPLKILIYVNLQDENIYSKFTQG